MNPRTIPHGGAALKSPSRWHVVPSTWVLAAMVLLCGCSALPEKKGASGELTGALLAVRLTERLETPAALQVEVALVADGASTSITARRRQSVPGRYADYLVALALPPQNYVLTAMRDAAVPADDPAGKLATITLPFEVKAGGPAYLGRLVVSPAGPAAAARIEVQDEYEEDTVLFRSAIGALRSASIARDVIPNRSLVAAAASAPRSAPAAPSGSLASTASPALLLTVDTIAADADAAFTRPARSAFAKFLRLKPPRAFAIGDADARVHAYAAGSGAVERAMRDCTRLAAGAACHLFAVDDTLLSSSLGMP